MKSPVLLMLSFLLIIGVFAPSIIALTTSVEHKALAMDFNETEKNENIKDFFFESNLFALEPLLQEHASISNFCIESAYSASLSIFLLPPKQDI